MNLPSSGIHPGVPFDVYRQWPAVNISTLKHMRRSALHCRWEQEHPRESDEMDVGSALHVAILEPARFEKEFYLGDVEYDARTKEGKEIQAREEHQAAGRTYIRRRAGKDAVDADDVRGMREAVWQHGASRFLKMGGQCEVSLLWQDHVTGLMCKGRFDKLISPQPRAIKLELKSCVDAREWEFGKSCEKFGYAAQDAFYRWGYQTLTGTEPLSLFLAIENKGPWASALWTLDDLSMQAGAAQFREWLDAYAECSKSGRWPGYSGTVGTLSLPRWATQNV